MRPRLNAKALQDRIEGEFLGRQRSNPIVAAIAIPDTENKNRQNLNP
jgi:hypothetical protein